MLLIGFAGVGYVAYRRKEKLALMTAWSVRADAWFVKHDPEGVAFEYDVIDETWPPFRAENIYSRITIGPFANRSCDASRNDQGNT
jgi:hypothetical protein